MQPEDSAPSTAELLSRLLDSVDETASLAGPTDVAESSHHVPSALPYFSALVGRLNPILHVLLQQPSELADAPTATIKRSAVESLDSELRRSRCLAERSTGYPSALAARLLDGAARNLARGVRVLAGAWADAPANIRSEMEALQMELMEARFQGPASDKGGGTYVDTEDLVVRIKNGEEDELWVVISEIEVLLGEGLVWEEGGRLISALLNRLASAKSANRLKMIPVLRSLASYSTENKVAFRVYLCPFHFDFHVIQS